MKSDLPKVLFPVVRPAHGPLCTGPPWPAAGVPRIVLVVGYRAKTYAERSRLQRGRIRRTDGTTGTACVMVCGHCWPITVDRC